MKKSFIKFPILFSIFIGLIVSKAMAIRPTVISSSVNSAFSYTGSGNLVMNKPVGLQNGDMLIVFIHSKGTYTAPTFPTFTETCAAWSSPSFSMNSFDWGIFSGLGTYTRANIIYKKITNVGSEPATYSFSVSSTDASASLNGYGSMVQVRGTGNGSIFLPGVPAGLVGNYSLTSSQGLIFPGSDFTSVFSQGDSLWLSSFMGPNNDPGLTGTAPTAPTSTSGFTNLQYVTDSYSLDYGSASYGYTGAIAYPYSSTDGYIYNTTLSMAICEKDAPIVLSYLPVNNSVHVPRVSTLKLTFNENIQKGTGNIYIKKYSNDATLLTIPVSNTNVIIEDNVFKIRLLSCIVPGELVYVTIESNAVKDFCNNYYAGISNKDTWKFYMARICNMQYCEL